MEFVGAFPEGEWDCIGRMFTSDLDPQDHSPQLFLGEYLNIGSSYNSNFSGIGNYCFSNYPNDDHVLTNDNAFFSMDFCMDEKNFASYVPSSLAGTVIEENVMCNEDIGSDDKLESSDYNKMEPPFIVSPIKQLQLKRKLDDAEDEIKNRSENQKKKPRVPKDASFVSNGSQMHGQRSMKNERLKKNHQNFGSIEEEAEDTNNTGSVEQTSSGNISSEDDNASQENSVETTTCGSKSATVNSNGKTRASRGSATDPQSLYARKRRERINERLRILQNLVPNGTKVDISTMLEEAVNYVKFLQLQIKLLSSDDLWMYAPLAYNGLDIGVNLNLKSSSPL